MKRFWWTIMAAALAVWSGCAAPPDVSPAEVVAVRVDSLPEDGDDAVWRRAPVHVASLLLQDIVEPRLLKASTSRVEVQAACDGAGLAFRLSWEDAGKDDLPGIARFADACAVQLPAQPAADVPAPQMGEKGRAVEITYWSAFWQAAVDGRSDSIKELYPGATVDHYPFEAPSLEAGSEAQKSMAARYSPARALGNRMAGPRQSAVEDLVAQGPGTLQRAGKAVSEGLGRRSDNGWVVVLRRPLVEGMKSGQRTQVAFAVWQGSEGEVGARKMRSGWIPLYIQEKK